MNHLGLFITGTLVFLIVLAAAGLLVWGAILDGRYVAKEREAASDLASERAKRAKPVRAA